MIFGGEEREEYGKAHGNELSQRTKRLGIEEEKAKDRKNGSLLTSRSDPVYISL